jgi:CO/xanthine dehydrogenase FAD-binding subunit
MRLPRFDILVPETLSEACDMLSAYRPEEIRVLAGGTDLLVDIREAIIPQHVPRCNGCPSHPREEIRSTIDCGLWASEPTRPSGGSLRSFLTRQGKPAPKYLLSLHRLTELRGIERLPDGGLKIGAMTSIAEIGRSAAVQAHWPALSQGAQSLGSPLVRNRGTLGGNIANARPAADTVIPTVALGGLLTLRSGSGERSLPARDFPRGPGLTVIETGEILTSIELPGPPPFSSSAYYKLANRKALEISTVGVAVYLALESPDGLVADVRIALGAVGPVPIVADTARDFLRGNLPGDDALAKAAWLAAGDALPIDDHRGSAASRREMVRVLTERLLKRVTAEAKGKNEKNH